MEATKGRPGPKPRNGVEAMTGAQRQRAYLARLQAEKPGQAKRVVLSTFVVEATRDRINELAVEKGLTVGEVIDQAFKRK